MLILISIDVLAFVSSVVVLVLLDQLVVGKVDGKSTDSDAQTGECTFESVPSRELALITPGVTLSPWIAGTHVVGYCAFLIGKYMVSLYAGCEAEGEVCVQVGCYYWSFNRGY